MGAQRCTFCHAVERNLTAGGVSLLRPHQLVAFRLTAMFIDDKVTAGPLSCADAGWTSPMPAAPRCITTSEVPLSSVWLFVSLGWLIRARRKSLEDR